jgi:purine-binding chemotaxis protein CheW
MAKGRQPALPREDADPAEAATRAAAQPAHDGAGENLVVVSVADEVIGFRLRDVSEITRLPRVAYMPLGPRSLLGLANLRGSVLPIVGLRRLLSLPDAPFDDAARVVVTDIGAPVGIVVDRILSLDAVPAGAVETDKAGAGRLNPDLVDGVVKGKEGEDSIKLLKLDRLLRDEFSNLHAAAPRTGASVVLAGESMERAAEAQKVSLVSFDLGNQ